MKETLRTIDGRHVLRIERRLAHPPEKVWRALTESQHLVQWFPSDIRSDALAVGAKLRFVFPQESAGGEGVVTDFDPPRVFAYSWETDLLHWELQPEGAGCRLIFTHTFDDRPAAASYASGWKVCLDALEHVLRGEPVPAERDTAALHEAYVAAFGLDEGSSERTAEGWRVRFERQTPIPLARVWPALSGDRTPAVGDAAPAGFTRPGLAPARVTAVEAPTLLEYAWPADGRPGGTVTWRLSEGPQGARIVVTQTGADDPAAALAAWKPRIEGLVRDLVAAR